MNEYISQIESAVRAAQILSPTTYSWFGARSPELPEAIRRVLTPRTARAYLLYNLQWQLYRDFYCRGGAQPVAHEAAGSLVVGVTPFIEELQAANSGQGYWDEGWTALGVEGEDGQRMVAARKGDLTLVARPDEYAVVAGGDGSVTPGAAVALRFPKDLPGISPGFYMAMGDRALGQGDTVRVYWNVRAEGAVRLMSLATRSLNEAGLAFNLKVVSDPAGYNRCDAAVLYVRKGDYAAVSAILEKIYPEIEGMLSKSVPALTKRLAPGLGLAEDPGNGDSFGLHRCMLLAEGLLLAYEAGLQSTGERLTVALGHFTQAGVDLERPYLRPGSIDENNFGSESRKQKADEDNDNAAFRLPPSAFCLQTAQEIGRRLASEAVWHEGRCNWVGATLREPGAATITYKALGPDLYGGTAGVALFLAELCAVTQEPEARRTALGAIRQALSRVGALPPTEHLGLYSGKPGIALAAARVGLLLGEDELVERAISLAGELENESAPRQYDLLTGSAGAILGLLALREFDGAGRFVETAGRLGDELIEAADKRRAGWSWKAHGYRFGRNLTGFSHGAAGMGYALLELYGATGEGRHRMAAEGAFDYERTWFDPAEGNWPDFRDGGAGGRGNQTGPRQFATFWCHGAPGIALSRLRAYELLGDELYKTEAATALDTTRAWLEGALRSESGNYSLCHGLAGNAEVLFLGHHADAQDLALRVAAAGRGHAEAHGGVWACGAGGGETPGLMLGLAGIGLFYLRLHDPSVLSVLLICPREINNL